MNASLHHYRYVPLCGTLVCGRRYRTVAPWDTESARQRSVNGHRAVITGCGDWRRLQTRTKHRRTRFVQQQQQQLGHVRHIRNECEECSEHLPAHWHLPPHPTEWPSGQRVRLRSERTWARFTKYLTTILRLSYDNAIVTIDLRRTTNLPNRLTKGARLFLGMIH